jgi:hypothetical protein
MYQEALNVEYIHGYDTEKLSLFSKSSISGILLQSIRSTWTVRAVHGPPGPPQNPLGRTFPGYPSTVRLDGHWTMDRFGTLDVILGLELFYSVLAFFISQGTRTPQL